MVKTYYTNIENISMSESNISKISPERQLRVKKLMQETQKKQCLTAGLLINKLFPNKEVKLNQYGKPYIEDDFHFNIAHSDNYVIISVSSNEVVGCDIEAVSEYNYLKLGRVVFNKNEMNALKNAENQQEKFFELWTKKEAFLKCIGTGFHFKSKKIDLCENKHYVTYENQRYRFKEYMLNGYKIMLCSPSSEFAQELKEIVL